MTCVTDAKRHSTFFCSWFIARRLALPWCAAGCFKLSANSIFTGVSPLSAFSARNASEPWPHRQRNLPTRGRMENVSEIDASKQPGVAHMAWQPSHRTSQSPTFLLG